MFRLKFRDLLNKDCLTDFLNLKISELLRLYFLLNKIQQIVL